MKQEISLQTTPSPQDQSSEKEKPDFWKVIRELTPEDWIRHEILLYRRRPKLAIQGLGGFVAKFQYPFGIDDVKQAYGDYDWQAFLQKDGHVVTKIEFTIEAPPKPNHFGPAAGQRVHRIKKPCGLGSTQGRLSSPIAWERQIAGVNGSTTQYRRRTSWSPERQEVQKWAYCSVTRPKSIPQRCTKSVPFDGVPSYFNLGRGMRS